MAAPVLGTPQASFNPDPAAPGGSVQMTVNATDPDAQTYTVSGDVVDSQSNSVPFTGQFSVADPLTLQNLVSNPPGLVFTPTGNPLVYNITGF